MIAHSGKTLTTIYITHAHADHYADADLRQNFTPA